MEWGGDSADQRSEENRLAGDSGQVKQGTRLCGQFVQTALYVMVASLKLILP